MRGTLLVLLVMGISARADSPLPAGPAPDTVEARRAEQAVDLARKTAELYEIRLGGADQAPLKLVPEPVLRWSNPVAGSIHGAVFVWTSAGRPELVASIYQWFDPFHHQGVEFHSLATGPLEARREGRTVWSPAKGGVELRPLPDAATPSATPAQRLRQMRALAKEFAASETTREAIVRELRLLTQPIFRYRGDGAATIDGALFTFVEGTDPEVFLLLEARADQQALHWYYALARMNSVALKVTHRGREVWTAPEMPWKEVFAHREPYTLFTFQPGEGASRPKPANSKPDR